MAFTRVRGSGITTTDNYIVGVITATKFVGQSGGSASFDNVSIGGSLTVNGDFTTLNTTLREVELLQVDANSSTAAGIITQRGSGDILNLFDGSSQVFTVTDGGSVGINTGAPLSTEKLSIRGGANDSGKFTFHSYADFLGASDAWQGYSAIFRGAKAANANSQWLGIGATTANGWISFADNSDSKITITSSGVGIGDETPSYMLDVSGAINSQTDVKVGGVSVSETALNDAVAMAIALG